jgi:Ni/Co efflux regulator RcnB
MLVESFSDKIYKISIFGNKRISMGNITTQMYRKLTALVLVAAVAAVLITSATLANTQDADAKRKRGGNSQSSVQVNNCERNCQNAGSQIQGSGNSIVIVQSQKT